MTKSLERLFSLLAILPTLLYSHILLDRKHGLVDMHPENYLRVIRELKRTIVLVYDSTCITKHCSHAKHEFIEAAHLAIKTDMSEIQRIIHFALLDISKFPPHLTPLLRQMLNEHPSGDNPPLIFKFVHSYPIPFVPGHLDTSPENLANHFRKLMIKQAEHARTPDETKSFLETDLPVLVYKGHDRRSKMYAYFTIAESEYAGLIRFVHADSSEYMNGGPFPDKRLTLHRHYGKTNEIYEDLKGSSPSAHKSSNLAKESGVVK